MTSDQRKHESCSDVQSVGYEDNVFPSPTFRHLRIAATSDIDELGHVGNIALVGWLQDVAVRHSEHVGLSFARYRALGGVFVVRRHEIDYLRQVMLDDEVRLETHISEVGGAQCTRLTQMFVAEQPVLRCRTLWVYVELARGRPQRIPAEVREAFASAAPRG